MFKYDNYMIHIILFEKSHLNEFEIEMSNSKYVFNLMIQICYNY